MTWADQGLHLGDQTFIIMSEVNTLWLREGKDQAVGAALLVSSLTQSITAGLTLANDTKLQFEDPSGPKV